MTPSGALGWLRVALQAVGLIRDAVERTDRDCPRAAAAGAAAGRAAAASSAATDAMMRRERKRDGR